MRLPPFPRPAGAQVRVAQRLAALVQDVDESVVAAAVLVGREVMQRSW